MVQLLAQSSGGGSYAGLLIPVLLLGVFYFLLIRPQQRRAKELRGVRAAMRLAESARDQDVVGMRSTAAATA